jgi:hypothetical protein
MYLVYIKVLTHKPKGGSPVGNQKNSPKLYKKDSKGKMRVWYQKLSEVQSGTTTFAITYSGLLGGKLTERSKPIENSKVKKSFERAVTLMDNTVVKKIRDGYCRSTEEAESAGVLFKPMKAHTYEPGKTVLPFGFWIQTKINGVRAPYNCETDVLHTKSGLKYSIPAVQEELKRFTEILGYSTDGELYVPGLTAPEITGCAKRMNDPRRAQFEYHLYDCMMDEGFGKRWASIGTAWVDFVSIYGIPKYIKLVTTEYLKDPSKLQDKMDHYVYLKYEGLMVRLDDVPYEYGKRTKNLLKWKEIMDGEYEITGITYERRMGSVQEGGMKYLVEFHCKFSNGETFKAIPKWSVDRRHQFWMDNKDKKPEDLLPTLEPLLVEYREVTVNGLPFHAVAIDFRPHGY